MCCCLSAVGVSLYLKMSDRLIKKLNPTRSEWSGVEWQDFLLLAPKGVCSQLKVSTCCLLPLSAQPRLQPTPLLDHSKKLFSEFHSGLSLGKLQIHDISGNRTGQCPHLPLPSLKKKYPFLDSFQNWPLPAAPNYKHGFRIISINCFACQFIECLSNNLTKSSFLDNPLFVMMLQCQMRWSQWHHLQKTWHIFQE